MKFETKVTDQVKKEKKNMDKNIENVYDFSNVKTNLENFLLLILTPVLPGSHGEGSQTENKQERQPSTELLFHLQNLPIFTEYKPPG